MSLIFGPNRLFLLKYVPTLAQPKYFASLRICIFYIIYANAMIGQGWERSPMQTLQNKIWTILFIYTVLYMTVKKQLYQWGTVM